MALLRGGCGRETVAMTAAGTVALSVQMIARREIFLCDTWSGPK